jgi:hypothetical protein
VVGLARTEPRKWLWVKAVCGVSLPAGECGGCTRVGGASRRQGPTWSRAQQVWMWQHWSGLAVPQCTVASCCHVTRGRARCVGDGVGWCHSRPTSREWSEGVV